MFSISRIVGFRPLMGIILFNKALTKYFNRGGSSRFRPLMGII